MRTARTFERPLQLNTPYESVAPPPVRGTAVDESAPSDFLFSALVGEKCDHQCRGQRNYDLNNGISTAKGEEEHAQREHAQDQRAPCDEVDASELAAPRPAFISIGASVWMSGFGWTTDRTQIAQPAALELATLTGL
jgi:hypothetical protein